MMLTTSVPREFLRSLIPINPFEIEEPDPHPNCRFCGARAGEDQHHARCKWAVGRRILCETAETTQDADGCLTLIEFQDYCEHKGVDVWLIDGDDQSVIVSSTEFGSHIVHSNKKLMYAIKSVTDLLQYRACDAL